MWAACTNCISTYDITTLRGVEKRVGMRRVRGSEHGVIKKDTQFCCKGGQSSHSTPPGFLGYYA